MAYSCYSNFILVRRIKNHSKIILYSGYYFLNHKIKIVTFVNKFAKPLKICVKPIWVANVCVLFSVENQYFLKTFRNQEYCEFYQLFESVTEAIKKSLEITPFFKIDFNIYSLFNWSRNSRFVKWAKNYNFLKLFLWVLQKNQILFSCFKYLKEHMYSLIWKRIIWNKIVRYQILRSTCRFFCWAYC